MLQDDGTGTSEGISIPNWLREQEIKSQLAAGAEEESHETQIYVMHESYDHYTRPCAASGRCYTEFSLPCITIEHILHMDVGEIDLACCILRVLCNTDADCL